MSTHKHMDKICVVAIIISLLLSVFTIYSSFSDRQNKGIEMGYEKRLFDTEQVHTIDIVMDDWESFLSTAQSEEYSVCSVVIDGESIKNVGIRGKGNTSLSSVASMDSDRYSFKIEFDQYDKNKSYYGLDKLCLNNLIQDNTYMKDYLVYQMMYEFGVDSPLCSFAYLTVNGEDWGLYLAVEGIEDSFLQRNYGNDYGELYKPDSMNFGGGRGNGKDFQMSDFMNQNENNSETTQSFPQNDGENRRPNFGNGKFSNDGENMQEFMENAGFDKGSMFGMGSSDVKLQYIDDNAESYANIFDSAKTDVTDADKTRLINSLKQLSEYENLEEIVNIEEILRYFIVHNFVVNGDSYTGSMIHNYYLYEEDGQMSMIPWDYNLAFGTFQGNDASSAVNDDIDAVLSDRPMQAWIFSDEVYCEQYYVLYEEMLKTVDIQGMIENAYQLIASYVEKDPTAFCTYEEFETGVETLKSFCQLRAESVRLQLDGSTETVDTKGLNLSDMGTMGNRGGFENTGNFGNRDKENRTEMSGGVNMPEGMQIPSGSEMPEGMQIPSRSEIPEGMQIPNRNEMSGSTTKQEFGNMSSFNTMQTSSGEWILVGISMVILLLGLAFALKFKKYR